jgi:hypothetical protein
MPSAQSADLARVTGMLIAEGSIFDCEKLIVGARHDLRRLTGRLFSIR